MLLCRIGSNLLTSVDSDHDFLICLKHFKCYFAIKHFVNFETKSVWWNKKTRNNLIKMKYLIASLRQNVMSSKEMSESHSVIRFYYGTVEMAKQ